jgi:hypothetical protein
VRWRVVVVIGTVLRIVGRVSPGSASSGSTPLVLVVLLLLAGGASGLLTVVQRTKRGPHAA